MSAHLIFKKFQNNCLSKIAAMTVCLLLTSSALQAAGDAPTAPTNLTGSIVDGKASLAWDASVDNDGVAGYNVYINNQYSRTVLSNSYTAQLLVDTLYTFKIVAFDAKPRSFSRSSESLALPLSQGLNVTPSIPTGLTGRVEEGIVSLLWSPSTDDESVKGYNVYRDNEYFTTVSTSSYSTPSPDDEEHNWYIVAFDAQGNFSDRSEQILVSSTSPIDSTSPPSTPTELNGTVNSGIATLTWKASIDDQHVAGYNIYRNNRYVATKFSTQYQDTVEAGSSDSYTVVAFDAEDNFSKKSNPLSLPINANQPPFFEGFPDQTLQVGTPWELILSPVDPDSEVSGVIVGVMPSGMSFIDNMNNSHSLVWQPTASHIGEHEINVTAYDIEDSYLQTSETIRLTVADNYAPPTPQFSIATSQEPYNLQEGNTTGVDIPINLTRNQSENSTISLSVAAVTTANTSKFTATFSDSSLAATESNSTLNLRLVIDALPIQPHQRQFDISASNGSIIQTTRVTVTITPTTGDDVYLIIGQSNMVGMSQADAKQAGPGQLDEPNPRIKQANVTHNDSSVFTTDDTFTSITMNFNEPIIVTAEDPLHHPIDPYWNNKVGTRIGMGLSFAKAALPHTTQNIILVPAAWSASGFCESHGLRAHWNTSKTTNAALGNNSRLFDRAITRVNETLRVSNGILRGILWHQGESDITEGCEAFYEENLINLVAKLRENIREDARGSDARQADANIPFIVGTLSKGQDERGDYSRFSPSKLVIDGVHRSVSSIIAHSEVVNNDDLIPANGYPCGESSCIHFGSSALREMGARTYDALRNASKRID